MKYEDGKLAIERSDWTEKQVPPPGQNWDMILPVLNLHVGGFYIFASVDICDDPPLPWGFVVFIYRELEDKKLEVFRVQAPSTPLRILDLFPDEDAAIARANLIAEHLFTVARLLYGEENP